MKPPVQPIIWRKNRLFIIDQRKLPTREEKIEIKNIKDVWKSIKELKIRGAPAIGCFAGFGIAFSALKCRERVKGKFIKKIKQDIEYIKTSRPTAYNLFYALDRMKYALEENVERSIEEIKDKLVKEAENIYQEDLECCYKIGVYGSTLIKNGMNILTHCNAGGLATSGYGTALAPMYLSKQKGKKIYVYVDETRPVLQGARLTAWELQKAKIPYTLICDNMAAFLMQQGKIDLIIVGADRIASNGDTANKIGTYNLAVIAKYHKVKFYIAAPFSTFDFSIKTGKEIPIEERKADEVRKIKNIKIAPEKCSVYNPAFDITPSKLIDGFITEKGIIKPPYIKNLKSLKKESS